MTTSYRVHAFPDDTLGNTSYLIEVGRGDAIVIDPPRDVSDHVRTADRVGTRIVAALETHLHADFVSGSHELSASTGAEVVAPTAAGLEIPHRGVREPVWLRFGDVSVAVLATPGHTPEHVSYVLLDEDAPQAVFSGGSLIGGGAARTDLISPDRTIELARLQHASLRRLANLPDEVHVHPTHGAGSFCSTAAPASEGGTIADHRRSNPLLAITDEQAFVDQLVGGFGSYPTYFLELREVNRRTRLLRDLDPPRQMTPDDAAEVVEAGAWLVDARPMDTWAAAHPEGSVSIEFRGQFASWLGWVVPFGAAVVLIIDPADLADALAQARGIGYDRVVGYVDADTTAWDAWPSSVASTPVLDPAEASDRADDGAVLVDVRLGAEVASGRIAGAVHVELGDIIAGKNPPSGDVVTYCGAGQRAATAASLLARRGLRAAYMPGGVNAWQAAGLAVER